MPKTILITGASTGFGRDTAETKRRSYRVRFDARSSSEEPRKCGGAAQASIDVVALDIGDDASVSRPSLRCWLALSASMCSSTTPASRRPGNRGVHSGPGEDCVQHQCGGIAAHQPRGAAGHARMAMG